MATARWRVFPSLTRHLIAREDLLLERDDERSATARVEPPRDEAIAQSRRVAGAALLLLPTGLMIYLAFNAGGFFPGTPAYVAVILCVVLTLRVIFAAHPFEGINWRVILAVAAMSLYALETLLSNGWSHAPGVARIEFDLPLVYLLVMVLFGSIGHRGQRLALMLRLLALGILVVCTCGLITRVLPHLWPTSPDIANNRLSYPITYWNALGLLAALGLVLCLHFTSDMRERWPVRVMAAAALPVQACTLYFTFSRGGILAALLAVAVYVALGRPRGIFSALAAAGPPTAVALVVSYHANLLATVDPTTPAAVSQGRHVAIVLAACLVGAAGCRAMFVPLDQRLARLQLPVALRRSTWIGWACLAAGIVVVAIAFHSTIAREWQRFVNPTATTKSADLRTRLTNPANDGRIYTWRVAWHGFESAPLLGHGAGTYADTWAQRRPVPTFVLDAHSLYMETLDELGIVGFVLLLTVILVALWGAARRIRGARRPLYAAVFAVMLAWALHAGIDWDWEMPALSLIFFALGGAALARRTGSSRPRPRSAQSGRRRRSSVEPAEMAPRAAFRSRAPRKRARKGISAWRPRPVGRALLGLGYLALAVLPAYVWLAQRKLDTATNALNAENCHTAMNAARSSISTLSVNAQAYEILGYCDIRRNLPNSAVAAINKAVSLDPHNYNYAFDLAVIRAAAGLNPLPAARKAVSLNPLDPDVEQVWHSLRFDRPSQWPSVGRQFVREFWSL